MIDPIAFSVFEWNVYWYGVYYAIGFLFSYFFLLHYSKDFGIKKELIEDIYPIFIIASVLGGRVFYVIFYNFSFFLHNPLEVFAVWHGGMSIHGGIFGGFLALWYYARKKGYNVLSLTDLFVVPVSLGLAFGRLANFVNQELVGRVTSSSFGVVFPLHDDKVRWPYALFAGFKNLVLFEVLFFAQVFLKLKKGMLTVIFLVVYSLGRFAVDFLREPTVSLGVISMGQLLCLVYAAVGFWLWCYIRKKN